MHAASNAGRGRSLVMPRAGDVVAGKYLIVRVLGEGGMGVVYEATHQKLRQRVAIKMLLPSMLQHDVIVSRFEREARAAAQLRGRHIARVNDVDLTSDGLPYIVMDFLEGRDLQVEMEARGVLPIAEAVDYVLQACAAMVEAHHVGIVHRDLKPSNLFLEDDGGRRIVRVLDFGISKVSASAEAVEGKLTEVDTIVGTAMYMSPEQVHGSDAIDGRADIWSLGVILYEALAGRVPWMGSPPYVAAAIVTEDPPALRSLCSVPSDLAAIVHKTLERNPDNRFASVKELATALAPFAPVGSFGRAFADGVVAAGTHPRVAITPLVAVAVVGEDAAVTTGASSSGQGTTTTTTEATGLRAALMGVLVAFVIGLLTIGGVVVFIRPRMNRAPPSVATKTPETRNEPTATASSTSSTPGGVVSALAPSSSVSSSVSSTSSPSSSITATSPSTAPLAPKAARTSMSPRSTSATPTPTAPAKPPATGSGATDKPLFL